MSVQTNVGKITTAIEQGRRAYASIDFGPIKSADIISAEQEGIIADWQNTPDDPNLFLFGIHTWADPSRKVTK